MGVCMTKIVENAWMNDFMKVYCIEKKIMRENESPGKDGLVFLRTDRAFTEKASER